ncbi:MAG: sporulation transcriptional regulator SpoIIID [Ruminococcus sp.]|nr:sporulation transcriptional regulator SpoIIID [Ruminococcus sp.]MBQ1815370.1 sporulation transcriptional regulator SpoIIID [Ruminococcus sp.]MEE0675416.1 sporulation transcriptional regulator SpoIIID [Ruminococcus sp.]MEE0855805.1 sporulation transcriptional regulator SpoIIID [Ruminococcus sp.]
MNYEIENRAEKLGEYIIDHNATVRGAAQRFGVSKSTVHKDVSQRLRALNPALYAQVRRVLDANKSERHIRGGMATKKKYLLRKKLDTNC